MVYLGVKPSVGGWKAQTNPQSYGGTPSLPCKFTLHRDTLKPCKMLCYFAFCSVM